MKHMQHGIKIIAEVEGYGVRATYALGQTTGRDQF